MYLCSDGHEEIVHEDSDCPVCEEIIAREKVEETLEDKESDLSQLKDDYANLEKEHTDLQRDYDSLVKSI